MGLPIDRGRAWRAAVLLLVAGMHVWIGWALVRFHPEPMPTKDFATTPPEGTLIVLTFTSADVAVAELVSPRARDPVEQYVATKAHRPSTWLGPADASVERGNQQPPLNLAIAPDDAPYSYKPHILQHQRALEYEPTRFAHVWQSEGTLVDIVASRSGVGGALLGALGALAKPCTERQKSHYDPACVPAQYVHPSESERERDFD